MNEKKKKKRLSDEVLLDALVRLGGKVTATELAQVLDFPDRTIRYRIQRLRENGILGRVWPQTHDVKLGLGDASLLLEISERYLTLPREFLFCFPNLYANYATYGRYTGVQTGAGYPIENPQMLDRILRALKRLGIIKDSYVFRILDFISLAADLSKYNPSVGWNWDWKEWVQESKRILKVGEKFPLQFDTNPTQFDYDHKDIEIIAEMKMYGAELTHKELSKRVGLSETQVGVRLRRLEDAGVLRGYLWLTEKTPRTIVVFVHMELDEPDHPILSCFYNLPFRREISMDSPDKFSVRLTLDSGDVSNFLKGFESLCPYMRSYFIQFGVHLKVVPGGMHGFYHLHSEDTNRWEIPVEEYIQNLEKYIDGY